MFSLIIPTYNESRNIGSLLDKINFILNEKKINFEIIVVDDNSPDETWKIVEEIAKENSHVRLIKRLHDRGLSSAVVEGFRAAKGTILGVMDADHSHDARILPDLIRLVSDGKANCAVGSRRVTGGGVDEWPLHRKLFSGFATGLARFLTRVSIQDPMSGFFCISRSVFESVQSRLKPKGYKILLEILVRANSLEVKEIPYVFSDRKQNDSKLSFSVASDFLKQLASLLFYRIYKKS